MAERVWYEPDARYGHVAAAVEGKLYVWGGLRIGLPESVHDGPRKTAITSLVDVLDLQQWVWQQEHTTGSPPLGVYLCGFTVVAKRVVVYGGHCGHGACWHNSLHELDTTSLKWKGLAPNEAEGAPIKKCNCGVVAHNSGGEEQLCVFGGYGPLNSAIHQATAEYIEDTDNTFGDGWTNEFHCFTSGCWSIPTVTGSPPPPCCGFSFTKITEERVIMFGGYNPVSDPQTMNYIYTLILTTLHWTRVSKPDDPTVPWPVGRNDHSSCLLAGFLTGHQYPVVVVVGGEDSLANNLSDVWIRNEESWKQVSIPNERMVMRQDHTATAIAVSSFQVVVVVFGGLDEWIGDDRDIREQPMRSETAVLEFELQQSGGDEREWVLTSAADLTNYKILKAKDEQLKEKDKEKKVKEEELRMMKSVGQGIVHQMETQSQQQRKNEQQLREKEKLVNQLEMSNVALRQEMDQLKLLTAEATGFLSAVEVFAKTRFEVSAERSPLAYQWEGHGLRLQLHERATASFIIRAVWSNKFQLPNGTELVSPVYWVSCEGEVGGRVGVELQHCAQMREEEQQSGLSFAVCKVEKAEPPYQFELCEGQFSSKSSYGRVEMEFSSKLVAIIKWMLGWGPDQSTADPMFLVKVYYHQQHLSAATAHFVVVPHVDVVKKWLEQHYESRAEFIAGPSVGVMFREEKISLQLENGDLSPFDKEVEKDGWKMTPLNPMEVSRREVTKFIPPGSDPIPLLLRLKWVGGEEPQSLVQKVVLNGSKDTKFLTICQPPIPIAPAAAFERETPEGCCELIWKLSSLTLNHLFSCCGAVFVLFAVLLGLIAVVLHSLHQFSDIDSSSANLILSVNNLISEIPPISDPVDFCLCLDMSHSHCEQILTDHQGNTRRQVTKMVAEWHKTSLEPTWEKMVAALFCHQHNRAAVQLAERRGVNWRPLRAKWKKQF